MDFNTTFWIKFAFCFIIFVILPVWVFNIADISFLWKSGFTLAGAVGVGIALAGKTARYHQ